MNIYARVPGSDYKMRLEISILYNAQIYKFAKINTLES